MSSSREEYRTQIESLTQEMLSSQEYHRREILRLSSEREHLSLSITSKTQEIEQMKQEKQEALEKIIDSLDCIRGELEISEDDFIENENRTDDANNDNYRINKNN